MLTDKYFLFSLFIFPLESHSNAISTYELKQPDINSVLRPNGNAGIISYSSLIEYQASIDDLLKKAR